MKKCEFPIKLLVADCDGVLTDGSFYVDQNGSEIKRFHTYDGVGFRKFQQMGVNVAIISGEDSASLQKRAEKLKIKDCYLGVDDKAQVLTGLMQRYAVSPDLVGYCGDDENDFECLKMVRFPFCPSSAPLKTKQMKNIHVTQSKGGSGVIREVYEYLEELIPENK